MITQTLFHHNRTTHVQANALLYLTTMLIAVIVLYIWPKELLRPKQSLNWITSEANKEPSQTIHERYGFESGAEGWKPTQNESSSAIQSVSKSPARKYIGNYSLRLELDLRGSHAMLSKGEAFVDMQNYPPYGVPIPIDLTGREISISVWLPAGLRGPDSSPNGLQVFSKDVNFKSEYGAWENIQENTWMQVKLTPSTIIPTGGTMDPGFDPTRIRIIGLKIGTADASTDSYKGELYIDSVCFSTPPAPQPAVLNERYSFEQSDEGFVVSSDPQFQAITSHDRDRAQAANGTASNRLTIRLDGDESSRKAGEVYIDMLKSPPFRVDTPIDLEGKEVSVYVFCPSGARGDGGSPNAVQLFAKDDRWRGEYGSWTPIVEGYWMKIMLTPSIIAPPNGYKDDGFDPKRIRTLGIKIAAGARGSKYDGMIFMDGFSFPAELVPLQNLKYGFEHDKQGWQYITNSSLPAVTSLEQSSDVALEGSKALRLNFSAIPGDGRACGTAEVDMFHFPPPEVRAPINLEKQSVEAYVYCPAGSQSQNSQRPSQLRLFVKDVNFKSEYGAPTTLLNGQWVRLRLEPSRITPPDGYTDDGFDPSKVRTIGIEICMTGAYNRPVYIDHISFPTVPAAK
ncbi:MAG TPA: hypothetical protein VJ810_39545 [Blastocatellia bacterium]|nr:hypothetical protein [Blastocatellia bacterium]